MRQLSLREQAEEAIRKVGDLFGLRNSPQPPEDATIESLWKEVLLLRGQFRKPKKVDAIKLILEDPELCDLSHALIADIIRSTFASFGQPAETTESSIRWYISQKTLEWNIVPRRKMK